MLKLSLGRIVAILMAEGGMGSGAYREGEMR